MVFFENMDMLLKTYWFLAIPTSLIFAIQSIITFIGADTSESFETDSETGFDEPFQIFSLRNLINFLLGFSWSGISFYGVIENRTVLMAVSLVVGCLFIYLFFIIISQMQKLAEDNSFKIASTINKTAEVYLPIPESKTGTGKVMISVGGSYRELIAMTENHRIETGTMVKVVRLENDNILVVETL